MDCFQDFCLYCDRDSPDGPYCSQQCKLADLERSAPSSPASVPSRRSWNLQLDTPITAQQGHHSQQQHRQQPQTRQYTVPSSASQPRSSTLYWTPPAAQRGFYVDERQLTPSSSRTSLSSTSSASTSTPGNHLSMQNQQQLQDYFSSFDQARAAKRRSSVR